MPRRYPAWRRIKAACHVLQGVAANAVGATVAPRIAHFCITWRCNQRCDGCSVPEQDDGRELSTEQIASVFRRLSSLDVIKIVGGEPFARDDFADASSAILDGARPYLFQVITNGSMPDRVVDFARRLGRPGVQIRVSLSGFGETHERITGASTFENVHETLSRLAELRDRRGFLLGINYRLSDATIADLAKVRSTYEPMGVHIVPGLHYRPFLGDVNIETAEFSLHGVTDPSRLADACEHLRARRHDVGRLERRFLHATSSHADRRRLFEDRHKVPFGCRELRNLMYLLPDGRLVYCGLRHPTVANLVHEDLRAVWFGDAIREHRRQIDACPGCPQTAIEIFSRLYRNPLARRDRD